jgi:hypothetical protein
MDNGKTTISVLLRADTATLARRLDDGAEVR